MCKNTYLIEFFEKQPKIGKKAPPKNDNFWHFAKHRFIKKTRYVATPLFTQNRCFLKKTLMLSKKQNIEKEKKQR